MLFDFSKKITTKNIINFKNREVVEKFGKNFVDVGLLEPTLVNSYDRQYFLNRDAEFRLTVDTNLNFMTSILCGCHPSPFRSRSVIVEIKFARGFFES